MKNKKLIVFGAGGHAVKISKIASKNNFEMIGYISIQRRQEYVNRRYFLASFVGSGDTLLLPQILTATAPGQPTPPLILHTVVLRSDL